MTQPPPAESPPPESQTPAETPKSSVGAVIALTIAGVIAGCIASPIVHRLENRFPMVNLTEEQTNLLRANPDDPVAWGIERQNRWDHLFRNSALCLGIFGALLGALVGLVEGLTRRSFGKAVIFAVSLALCGAIGGVLAAPAIAAIGVRMQDNRTEDPLPYAIKMHAAAFGIIGAALAAGIAFATRRWSVLFRAAAGGAVAGVLCAPLASFLFPLYRTDLAIPEGLPPKLMFYSLAGGLIALCIARSPLRTGQTPLAATDAA